MLKAYKYRIYPNKAQEALIEKHFNACRFIYNLALETKLWAWKTQRVRLSAFDLMYQLPELKEDNEWLKEIAASSLQATISKMDKAFSFFFSGSGYPKFKSKMNKKSYPVPAKTKVDYSIKKISLPKIGNIRFADNRIITGKIKSSTVSKTSTGKYFVSICVETGIELPVKELPNINHAVGIDLGIKSFLTTSTGTKIDNPAYLKKGLVKLKTLSQKLCKKQKGSNRFKKQKLLVAKCYEKISNQRNNFLHKVSNQLISDNQTICIETLKVSNIIRFKPIARSVADCGWSSFVSMLKYKADEHAVNILKVGMFTPTSKTCSSCGNINRELLLKNREWLCSCGTKHDRDINAAINIKEFAFKENKGDIPLSSKQTAIGIKTRQKVKRCSVI